MDLTKASAAGWACRRTRALSASVAAAAPPQAAQAGASSSASSPALEWTHWQSDAVVLQSVTRRLTDLFSSGIPTIVEWAQKVRRARIPNRLLQAGAQQQHCWRMSGRRV